MVANAAATWAGGLPLWDASVHTFHQRRGPCAVTTASLLGDVMIDGEDCRGKPWDALLPKHLRNYRIGPAIVTVRVPGGGYSLDGVMWHGWDCFGVEWVNTRPYPPNDTEAERAFIQHHGTEDMTDSWIEHADLEDDIYEMRGVPDDDEHAAIADFDAMDDENGRVHAHLSDRLGLG